MKTLPFDTARCSGRMDLLPDGQWCDQRDTCKRYLSFTQWDRGVVPDYRGIPVSMAVRRLTPRETERLQGFPDDWTLIPWRGKPADECPDGPRYKAIGNSKAVPVVRWIARRIQKAIV